MSATGRKQENATEELQVLADLPLNPLDGAETMRA